MKALIRCVRLFAFLIKSPKTKKGCYISRKESFVEEFVERVNITWSYESSTNQFEAH